MVAIREIAVAAFDEQALLEREVLDAREIQMIIEGKDLPAKVAPVTPTDGGDMQKVLKPEPGRAGVPRAIGANG